MNSHEYAAEELLRRFSPPSHPLAVPVPVDLVAGWMGFQVVPVWGSGLEFSGLVTTTHKLIAVNGYHHRHRQRFSIAHELGHAALGHAAHAGAGDRNRSDDREADLFAAALLVPRLLVMDALAVSPGIDALAARFDVSSEVLRIRMNTLRLLPYSV